MEEDQESAIVREILRGVQGSASSPDRMRLLRARLRGLGDEIGEPILAEPKEVPAHYVTVEVPVGGVPGLSVPQTLVVAMTPRAAERILARL